jgi:signal transduction histidine kinase
MLELLKRVDSFLFAANMVDASIPPLFWRQSLLSELEEYASALPPSQQPGPRPSTKITIDPRIEREGPWAKLAIYRVITEAMNNAIFHAQTKEIVVKAQRQAHAIWVQIVNDGKPIPDSAGERRSRRGIFSLFQELQERFRATTDIRKGDEGIGTVVDVLIPVIPLNHEA